MSEEESKRPVGRPTVVDAEKKRHSNSMYLTDAEHVVFAEAVEASGLSISNFIRRQCAEFIGISEVPAHVEEEDQDGEEGTEQAEQAGSGGSGY